MGPPHGPKNLEDFNIAINEIEVSTLLLEQNLAKENLTQGEEQALGVLSKDPHITIKPADKGGAIVVQNTRDYVKEGMRHTHMKDSRKIRY